MLDITAIPAFQDNYIWALHNASGHCVVVDPGDANAVEHFLQQHGLQLNAILITHHHWDHTGGVEKLCAAHSVPVYGPNNPAIKGISHSLDEPDKFELTALNLQLQVLSVPGHTLDHIAYYCPDNKLLFCGDTLFHGGCGRLFEGTPQQMLSSLNKLAALPGNTQVYCTHEYTLANLEFAHAVEPNNATLTALLDQVQQQRQREEITLPTQIEIQRQINPFLRSTEKDVIDAARKRGTTPNDAVAVFAAIRQWKDNF